MVRVRFKKGGILQLVAKDGEGAMALKYWEKENQEHVGKLFEVDYSLSDMDDDGVTVAVIEPDPLPHRRR